MKKLTLALAVLAATSLATPLSAQQVQLAGRPLLTATSQLKNGEYIWAPELSSSGSLLFVVNLETQRAVLFRNGVPMAATTLSSGKTGNETPTGVFTILQKNKEHYSKTYNNAPMSGELHRLSNGVSVAVDPMPGAQSAAIGLYAMVGSRSEPEHLSGLAHLVEHMRANTRPPTSSANASEVAAPSA